MFGTTQAITAQQHSVTSLEAVIEFLQVDCRGFYSARFIADIGIEIGN